MKKEIENNVVVGPWKKSSKTPPKLSEEEIKKRKLEELKNNIMQIEKLTENIVLQMIHTLKENNFDLSSTNFIKDVAFVNESIKGLINRQYGYENIMIDLMDKLIQMKKKDGKYYTTFRVDILKKIVEDS